MTLETVYFEKIYEFGIWEKSFAKLIFVKFFLFFFEIVIFVFVSAYVYFALVSTPFPLLHLSTQWRSYRRSYLLY